MGGVLVVGAPAHAGAAAAPRAAGGRAEPGFGLVELVVALAVLVMLVVSMLPVVVNSTSSLAASRQRQAAAALATQALERVRALDYTVATKGLRSTDVAGDPFVVQSGSTYSFRAPGMASAEPLVVNGDSSTVAPLWPHVVTTSNPAFRVAPTVSTYVTNDATAGVYAITVLVRWTPVSGQPQLLVQRSKLYSPPGSGGAS